MLCGTSIDILSIVSPKSLETQCPCEPNSGDCLSVLESEDNRYSKLSKISSLAGHVFLRPSRVVQDFEASLVKCLGFLKVFKIPMNKSRLQLILGRKSFCCTNCALKPRLTTGVPILGFGEEEIYGECARGYLQILVHSLQNGTADNADLSQLGVRQGSRNITIPG